MRHRVDAPYYIETHIESGKRIAEEWVQNDISHKADGPAAWRKDPETDVTVYESYWKNGKLDREEGPAVLMRDRETGEVTKAEHHSQGHWFSPYTPEV